VEPSKILTTHPGGMPQYKQKYNDSSWTGETPGVLGVTRPGEGIKKTFSPPVPSNGGSKTSRKWAKKKREQGVQKTILAQPKSPSIRGPSLRAPIAIKRSQKKKN